VGKKGMRVIQWRRPSDVCKYAEGEAGGHVKQHLNLTRLHGEREYLRQGFLLDVDGDGELELITRTLNANRARAIRLTDGATVWLSPDVAAPPEESAQISQIDVGDLDEDGVPEVILASYHGDVICLDSRDGSVKWHRRLGYCINNPRIEIRKVTPGPGRNLAFTVGRDVRWTTRHARPRINFVRHPSLLVLDADGSDALLVPEYAAHNSDGHNTWLHDIDGDGCCEIAVTGDNRLIWFDHNGRRLFDLPCEPEEAHERAHPDAVLAWNWRPRRPGMEILYLHGTGGIVIADSRGEVLCHRVYPHHVASHLQEITVLPRADGLALVAENIRASDSKLLFLDRDLAPRWAAQMAADMTGARHLDWDGDGEHEIVTGSNGRDLFNPNAPTTCSLQIMRADGRPLYWHRWEGETACRVLDVGDVDRDGNPELIVSVGTHGGREGRFSIHNGGDQHLYVIGRSA